MMAQLETVGRLRESNKDPALLACLACRRKHVKCDGKQPVCKRCQSNHIECDWKPSRRGYRRASKRTEELQSHAQTDSLARVVSHSSQEGLEKSTGSTPSTDAGNHSQGQGSSPAITNSATQEMSTGNPEAKGYAILRSNGKLSAADSELQMLENLKLVNYYYAFFHPSHPIMFPRPAFCKMNPRPPAIEAALYFVGAHYHADIDINFYHDQVVSAVANTEKNSIAFITANLILAIVYRARNDLCSAKQCLDLSLSSALAIGLNKRDFAYKSAGDKDINREAMRRTWWELYVTKGLLAAIDQNDSFDFQDPDLGTELPCEEDVYQCVRLPFPKPVTICQFYDRIWMQGEENRTLGPEWGFSSFANRIDAVHIISRAVAVGSDPLAPPEQIVAVAGAMDNWQKTVDLHKPNAPFNKDAAGKVDTSSIDQMIFQAQTIIHCASIYLYLPRSNLLPSISSYLSDASTSQIPPPIFVPMLNISSGLTPAEQRTHAAKALAAADAISALADLQAPADRHTPFFSQALLLDMLVQLSVLTKAGADAGAQAEEEEEEEEEEEVQGCNSDNAISARLDKIAFGFGILETMGRTWPVARSNVDRLREYAFLRLGDFYGEARQKGAIMCARLDAMMGRACEIFGSGSGSGGEMEGIDGARASYSTPDAMGGLAL